MSSKKKPKNDLIKHDFLISVDMQVKRHLLLLNPDHVVFALAKKFGNFVLGILKQDDGDRTSHLASTLVLLVRTLNIQSCFSQKSFFFSLKMNSFGL